MLEERTTSQIRNLSQSFAVRSLFDRQTLQMLEMMLFDGGSAGWQGARLSSVEDGLNRRTRKSRNQKRGWYPDCSCDGEPKQVREVSALTAWAAPTHDRDEEVAVHA